MQDYLSQLQKAIHDAVDAYIKTGRNSKKNQEAITFKTSINGIVQMKGFSAKELCIKMLDLLEKEIENNNSYWNYVGLDAVYQGKLKSVKDNYTYLRTLDEKEFAPIIQKRPILASVVVDDEYESSSQLTTAESKTKDDTSTDPASIEMHDDSETDDEADKKTSSAVEESATMLTEYDADKKTSSADVDPATMLADNELIRRIDDEIRDATYQQSAVIIEDTEAFADKANDNDKSAPTKTDDIDDVEKQLRHVNMQEPHAEDIRFNPPGTLHPTLPVGLPRHPSMLFAYHPTHSTSPLDVSNGEKKKTASPPTNTPSPKSNGSTKRGFRGGAKFTLAGLPIRHQG